MPDNIISDIYLFADDTKIFNTTSNPENAKILQDDLNRLQEWSDKWLLLFHPQKCTVLDIGINDRTHYEYYLGDVELRHEESEKDLGVHIDNKLKFDTHINNKVTKANNILGAIRRGFSYLDETTLLQLYTSLVRPHLEYANPVWNPKYAKDIVAIENVQRRATKMVPATINLSYEERLKHLRLPTLAYRRLRGDMIECYKILNKKYDHRVSNFLLLNKDKVQDPTKVRGHNLKLYKSKHTNAIKKNSFGLRCVGPWNSLPDNIVNAPSIATFERRLDKFWSTQPIKYNFRECLKITHTNNTPFVTGSPDEANL